MLKRFCAVLAACCFCSLPLFAVLSFPPDTTFKGSDLKGWATLGAADWSAHDGELVAALKQSSSGSWLLSDQSYQDVGLHTAFRCDGACQVGLLLRAVKTPAGTEGIYVSLDPNDLAFYQVALDSQGNIVKKLKLDPVGGVVRIAPPEQPRAGAAPRSGAGRGGNFARSRPQVDVPIPRPDTSLKPNEWNDVEVFVDVNVVRLFINDGPEIAGRIPDADEDGYGPVALYASGSSEVHFKDLSFKDLAKKTTQLEKVSPHYRVQRISDMFYSWGMAAGDFNRDGKMDVVAGPYIYYGPDFTHYQEIYPAAAYNPTKDFPAINAEYVYDFNKDGWPDILTGPPQATLYLNPHGTSRRWEKHLVVPNVQSEITVLADVDGDGIPALVYESGGTVRYAKTDPSDPTKPWVVHTVSEPGYGVVHGIGAGDINGDGLMDIVNAYGWWEHPPRGSSQEPWVYHPEAFGRYDRGVVGGAKMAVYDVNGDGLNDVVTSLDAHGFGLAWFEQKRDSGGKISFVQHTIMGDYSTKNAGGVTFSQLHGATFADMDGDGIPDFVVGKRYWTHLDSYHDPDPWGPPVLYVYHTVRNKNAPGGAEFVPELIHNRSGAGSDLLAVDLNKDGVEDIVTSTDRGTFIFWGIPRASKNSGRPPGHAVNTSAPLELETSGKGQSSSR